MKQLERRYQAGRVYHRPHNKHQVSSKEDHIFAIALTLGVGIMIGATVAIAIGGI
jgi:Na+/alanine symporter